MFRPESACYHLFIVISWSHLWGHSSYVLFLLYHFWLPRGSQSGCLTSSNGTGRVMSRLRSRLWSKFLYYRGKRTLQRSHRGNSRRSSGTRYIALLSPFLFSACRDDCSMYTIIRETDRAVMSYSNFGTTEICQRWQQYENAGHWYAQSWMVVGVQGLCSIFPQSLLGGL